MPTEKYAQRHRDLRVLPAARPHLRPLPARAVPDRDRERGVGRRPPQRWIVTTNRGDRSAARVRRHRRRHPAQGRSSRASRASRLRGQGVPHQPLGLRLHRRQPDRADGQPAPTSASASSAPAPPPCRSCRSSRSRPRSSTSSSARRQRVGVRDNGPTDAEWFAVARSRAGSASASSTSPTRSPASSPRSTWCTTAGPSSVGRHPEGAPTTPDEAAVLERIDFETMEEMRRRIDEIVEDPETAEKLKPWYGKNCKRLCFHDEYLPAFNQPERAPRRHRRQGRRAHHRERRRGRRRRVPGRLPRSSRRASRSPPTTTQPPRLRPGGPRRRLAERAVGRGRAHAARHPHGRLPEPAA